MIMEKMLSSKWFTTVDRFCVLTVLGNVRELVSDGELLHWYRGGFSAEYVIETVWQTAGQRFYCLECQQRGDICTCWMATDEYKEVYR